MTNFYAPLIKPLYKPDALAHLFRSLLPSELPDPAAGHDDPAPFLAYTHAARRCVRLFHLETHSRKWQHEGLTALKMVRGDLEKFGARAMAVERHDNPASALILRITPATHWPHPGAFFMDSASYLATELTLAHSRLVFLAMATPEAACTHYAMDMEQMVPVLDGLARGRIGPLLKQSAKIFFCHLNEGFGLMHGIAPVASFKMATVQKKLARALAPILEADPDYMLTETTLANPPSLRPESLFDFPVRRPPAPARLSEPAAEAAERPDNVIYLALRAPASGP